MSDKHESILHELADSLLDYFAEWSPAYPLVFHRERVLSTSNSFGFGIVDVVSNTVNTHSITISAIKKAGGYE